MAHLKEDVSVFGMKFEGWRKAAQKAGREFDEWKRREPSCSCGNGMRRRDANLQSNAQRLRQRHLPSDL